MRFSRISLLAATLAAVAALGGCASQGFQSAGPNFEVAPYQDAACRMILGLSRIPQPLAWTKVDAYQLVACRKDPGRWAHASLPERVRLVHQVELADKAVHGRLARQVLACGPGPLQAGYFYPGSSGGNVYDNGYNTNDWLQAAELWKVCSEDF